MMKKNKLTHYALYTLFFIILAVIVSFAAITVKHKIMDHQLVNTPANERMYSAYYNSLSYREQLLYDSITQAAEGLCKESEVIHTSYTMEDLVHIISCIRADRADLFYVRFDDLVLYNALHKTKIEMKYIDSEQNIKKMISDYNTVIEEAVALTDSTMTDFEKEVILTDYITDNCTYTPLSDDMLESTAYGALVKHQAMCDGYAYAAKALLTAAHIDTAVVFGTANDTEHVWNIVKIDSAYYHIDVTWNDSDKAKDKGVHFHGYFNMSENEILIDHNFDNSKGILPKANKSNNYYKQIGCYATKEEQLEKILYNALKDAVDKKKTYIELEYVNSYENAIIAPYLSNAIEKVNSEKGKDILADSFRILLANKNTNAITIQIIYNQES